MITNLNNIEAIHDKPLDNKTAQALIELGEGMERVMGIISRHASEPKTDSECMEAVNAQGGTCIDCELNCYRSGWEKHRVDKDNENGVKDDYSLRPKEWHDKNNITQ